MPVRRSTDPISVQLVWDAIRAANAQRQMADLNRILKYLQRVGKCKLPQAELYVQQALSDGLIMEIHKITVKGSRAGTEAESFRIPVQEFPTPMYDGSDWYCIDCHLAGDVIPCSSCHNVFHAECAYKNKNSFNESPLINLNSLIDKKKMNYVPIINNTPHITNNGNNENQKQEKFIMNDSCNQDVNLNRLVDDVERKLEKMDNLINVSDYEDPLSTENISTDITETMENGNSFNKNSSDNSTRKTYNETLCSVCNMCNTDPDLQLDKEELNYLISFVHNRVQTWVPVKLTDTVPPDTKPEWLTESEVNWRATQLFYQPMNMLLIEGKLQAQEYTSLSQFKVDILTVHHNIAVYHGIESQEYACAEFLWKDCQRELLELSNCVDCYKHSNEKVNNKWFCFPCRVPHRLVWAKQKGYPYWPAKLLREMEDSCDVRFFGGKYERSVLSKMYIKPITINMAQQIKKNSALHKAIEELRLHQQLLENPSQVQKYTSKKRRASVKSVKHPSRSTTPKSKGKKRSGSFDLPKDIDDFEDSLSNLHAASSTNTSKKKRLTSSAVKEDAVTNAEYSTPSTAHSVPSKKKGNNTNGTIEESSNPSIVVNEDELSREEEHEFGYDGGHQEVSSSTEHNLNEENSDGVMPQTERQYSEAVEKMRRKLEQCRDKKQLIKTAMESMQAEIDRVKDEHDEYIKKVFETHSNQISETKKKQWCYNCEQDAIYHCCWNTAYCSPGCQQQHWQAEHKKVCRRKR